MEKITVLGKKKRKESVTEEGTEDPQRPFGFGRGAFRFRKKKMKSEGKEDVS